jgi:hypothetical protein
VITGGGDPPPPVRKPFRIATGTDRIRVVPNGNAAPKVEELPISCVLEVAYEGLDQALKDGLFRDTPSRRRRCTS